MLRSTAPPPEPKSLVKPPRARVPHIHPEKHAIQPGLVPEVLDRPSNQLPSPSLSLVLFEDVDVEMSGRKVDTFLFNRVHV